MACKRKIYFHPLHRFWGRNVVCICLALLIVFCLNVYLHKSINFGRTKYLHFLQTTSHPKKPNSLPVIAFLHCGGLGNQLFQYSAAFALAKKRNSDLYICLPEGQASKNQTNAEISTFIMEDRSYALDNFKIPQDKILLTENENMPCSYPLDNNPLINNPVFSIQDHHVIQKEIPSDKVLATANCFESEIFFKEFKNELLPFLELNFTPDQKDAINILEQINSTESVAVHIRRGDYAYFRQESAILPVSYYTSALELMFQTVTHNFSKNQRNVTYFVFSDDIEIAKNYFKESIRAGRNYNTVFVSNQKFSRLLDFSIMKACKHFIIANSTFSWWAAYLGKYKDKIVIAPMPRFKPPFYTGNNDKEIYENIFNGDYSYPENWMTIDPKF